MTILKKLRNLVLILLGVLVIPVVVAVMYAGIVVFVYILQALVVIGAFMLLVSALWDRYFK